MTWCIIKKAVEPNIGPVLEMFARIDLYWPTKNTHSHYNILIISMSIPTVSLFSWTMPFFPGQSILLPCLNQHQKLSDTPRAVLSGYVSHKISPLISRWPLFLVINPQAIGTKLSTKMILHCVHKYPHCCWLYHQVSWSKQTNTLLFHGSSTIKIPISGIPIIKKDCWIPFN